MAENRARYHRIGDRPCEKHLFACPLPTHKARRCPKKPILAVASSMLTAVWTMLSNGIVYADLGPDYFSRLDTGKTIQRLLKRLAGLGYNP